MGARPGGQVIAAPLETLDQEQANSSGNVFTSRDSPKYQTFTPAITGYLSRIELNIFSSSSGLGAIHIKLYKESDLSTEIAEAKVVLDYAEGWTSVDFSGELAPYLKRETMYRIVASTENGGFYTGFGWNIFSSNPYPRGYSSAFGYDFSFRTYMVADYSISMEESAIASTPASITADGTSQSSIKVTLKDAQGNQLTSGGESVAIMSTMGTVSEVTDNQNGTYSAILTAPTTTGKATVSATVGGNTLSPTSTVQFTAGAPSLANSELEASPTSLTADGTSQSSIKVTLKDAQGNQLTSGGESVAIMSTMGTVSTVTDNQNGTYSAILTAPTTTGAATVSATVGGNTLADTVTVELKSGQVSAAHSTVTASELVVQADGSSKAAILVKLKDAYDHMLPNQQVVLHANGGTSVIRDPQGQSDQEGTVSFEVSNTAAERVTYSVEVISDTGAIELDQTVEIAFVYNQSPKIELQADPTDSTFDHVKVTVAATAYGEFNSIAVIKWAAGARELSYFETQGSEISDHFEVRENGIYSVYTIDAAGNENVNQIEIGNIVKKSSNGKLADWKVTGLGGVVALSFEAGKTTYTIDTPHDVYGLNMVLTAADAFARVEVNRQPVTSGASTKAYSLGIGKNTFDVHVTAQDETVQAYQLIVNRASASPVIDPVSTPISTPSGSTNPVVSPSSPSLTMVPIQINGQEVSGIAKLQVDENGKKKVEIAMDQGTMRKVLQSDSAKQASTVSITYAQIEQMVGEVTLNLPVASLKLIKESSVKWITLTTAHGSLRLPLTELVDVSFIASDDTELKIEIELVNAGAIDGLGEAAMKDRLEIAGDPVEFHVQIIRKGKTQEITRFNGYVEKYIFLPVNQKKNTAMVSWDNKKKEFFPVPARFIDLNGNRAAVINSMMNSVYVPVSKTSVLHDIQGHWALTEISKMYDQLMIEGTNDSQFKPEASVTRAELATILVRALGLSESSQAGGEADGFTDVSSTSWYSAAAEAVKANGLMNGLGNGTFGPSRLLSRQEAIVTIIRGLELAENSKAVVRSESQVDLSKYTDGGQIGSWAKNAMQTAIQLGLVKGDKDKLRPNDPLTRAETTVLLYRMLQQAGFMD
ncbi:S-layer homology domain-containing protein [Paenibacillus silvae]|nr:MULTISPECIES: invasin domain 3-containing protein [Paenibacillus]MCK6078034.1 S-layer homology domain-containing protein [Paenibacillus silvae]MCK6152376.1 S-layer homology domain-containing protein [Paenibacillus silvae]MCK6270917.1 S-layer homology domain-containing protein [Paenibacillus silvae]